MFRVKDHMPPLMFQTLPIEMFSNLFSIFHPLMNTVNYCLFLSVKITGLLRKIALIFLKKSISSFNTTYSYESKIYCLKSFAPRTRVKGESHKHPEKYVMEDLSPDALVRGTF